MVVKDVQAYYCVNRKVFLAASVIRAHAQLRHHTGLILCPSAFDCLQFMLHGIIGNLHTRNVVQDIHKMWCKTYTKCGVKHTRNVV